MLATGHAATITDENRAFTFVGTEAFTETPGDLRYTTRKKMTVIEGDIDGDGIADVQIELTGRHELEAGDFVL